MKRTIVASSKRNKRLKGFKGSVYEPVLEDLNNGKNVNYKFYEEVLRNMRTYLNSI